MVLFAFAAISSYLPGLSAQHSRRWHPRRVRSQNQRSCRTRSWEIQISLRTMILESKAQRRNPMICSLILLIRSSTYWTPQKLPVHIPSSLRPPSYFLKLIPVLVEILHFYWLLLPNASQEGDSGED
uniref:Uncharacterized protein n=1 Tax=Aegilops tauschii subsp. strangulata TaxID=200361 RepID=A0A453T055_AEGTS